MKYPTREHEEALFFRGCRLVAGLDEVGRGCIAGPVVAAAVVLPTAVHPEPWLPLVRDSKTLSFAQRERVFPYIQAMALHVGVGMASPMEIDVKGIVTATRLAMERALQEIPVRPDHLLVDALDLQWQRVPCTPLVGGDAICLPIAAASIIAKVTRDRFMVKQDDLYPGYSFARHKGYGTRQHLEALRHLGPCYLHRSSFAPVRDATSLRRHGRH